LDRMTLPFISSQIGSRSGLPSKRRALDRHFDCRGQR
jgi:hypothetical protein